MWSTTILNFWERWDVLFWAGEVFDRVLLIWILNSPTEHLSLADRAEWQHFRDWFSHAICEPIGRVAKLELGMYQMTGLDIPKESFVFTFWHKFPRYPKGYAQYSIVNWLWTKPGGKELHFTSAIRVHTLYIHYIRYNTSSIRLSAVTWSVSGVTLFATFLDTCLTTGQDAITVFYTGKAGMDLSWVVPQ